MPTGFPRSGTTLLENVLQSHPSIETFDEAPAASRLFRTLARFVPADNVVKQEVADDARRRYFDEFRHRRSNRSPPISLRARTPA